MASRNVSFSGYVCECLFLTPETVGKLFLLSLHALKLSFVKSNVSSLAGKGLSLFIEETCYFSEENIIANEVIAFCLHLRAKTQDNLVKIKSRAFLSRLTGYTGYLVIFKVDECLGF